MSIAADDALRAHVSSGGVQLYLWQHDHCPGWHNMGCFRMSTIREHPINDSGTILCNMHDALLVTIKKKYTRQCKLRFWTHLPAKDNAHLIVRSNAQWFKRYNSDPACWIGGVVSNGPV